MGFPLGPERARSARGSGWMKESEGIFVLCPQGAVFAAYAVGAGPAVAAGPSAPDADPGRPSALMALSSRVSDSGRDTCDLSEPPVPRIP